MEWCGERSRDRDCAVSWRRSDSVSCAKKCPVGLINWKMPARDSPSNGGCVNEVNEVGTLV